MRVLYSLFIALVLLMGREAAAAPAWERPADGPMRQTGKSVVYIAFDFRNGGISGVYRGLEEAVRILGWRSSAVDAKGDSGRLQPLFEDVIAHHPNAIILGGFGPEMVQKQVETALAAKIVLAGWHSAPLPGSMPGLFVNVTTDPAVVALAAAKAVIDSTEGRIGVVLFNDSQFSVANLKMAMMKKAIAGCERCEILAVEDIPIARADELVETAVKADDAKFGRRWTHCLAINDIYFDNMNYALNAIGREDISGVAAGDGSARALGRIRSGRSRQLASVAEPLTLQGWQLADELNRAFAGAPPSGYVSSPIVVTEPLLSKLGDSPADSMLPFKDRYQAIWFGIHPGD